MRHIPLILLLILVSACAGPSVVVNTTAEQPAVSYADGPRNVILFIADGCGPASFTMARDFLRETTDRRALFLDDHLVGGISTHSSDSRVTDSAASATAFACGIKTNNGAIAVTSTGMPVSTILEAAEAKGMATGLIATSRITHATPASFAAHVENRGQESEIAVQELSQNIEFIAGGGKRFFLPEEEGGSRKDGRNLLAFADSLGYNVAQNRSEYEAFDELPILALFSNDHMAYEIDRDPSTQPSLSEMVEKAIGLLSQSENGFFLMVEGSRIDHAGHANDPVAHVHDILAYDNAVKMAVDFAQNDGRSLVVATSDHETGGLSLGRNIGGRGIYDWKPDVIAKITASFNGMNTQIRDAEDPEKKLEEILGFDIAPSFVDSLQSAQGYDKGRMLSSLVSKRAIVGWTTGGHTAVDVPVFAFGIGAESFAGYQDNTAIGTQLADLLGLEIGIVMEEATQ